MTKTRRKELLEIASKIYSVSEKGTEFWRLLSDLEDYVETGDLDIEKESE